MSHNTYEGIRNLSPVSSISFALLFFYFITRYQHESSNNHKVRKLKFRELRRKVHFNFIVRIFYFFFKFVFRLLILELKA